MTMAFAYGKNFLSFVFILRVYDIFAVQLTKRFVIARICADDENYCHFYHCIVRLDNMYVHIYVNLNETCAIHYS